MPATAYVHINQHRIRRNHKTGAREPVITVKRGRTNTYGDEVVLHDRDGNEAARVVYRPDAPLRCGARVWIETANPVAVT